MALGEARELQQVRSVSEFHLLAGLSPGAVAADLAARSLAGRKPTGQPRDEGQLGGNFCGAGWGLWGLYIGIMEKNLANTILS